MVFLQFIINNLASEHNLCRKREEITLNDRKNNIHNKIMGKRLNGRIYHSNSLDIDPEMLSISDTILRNYENSVHFFFNLSVPS